MKKSSIHEFDAHGRAAMNADHLELRVLALEAENVRLKRVVVLQQKRWQAAQAEVKPRYTLH